MAVHGDLAAAFKKLVKLIKDDERCIGGWHYGSVGRGNEDIYSDYDPVFLVRNKDFEQFASDASKYMAQISDELLICWAEDYNSDHFKNFCSVIRLGDNLHQLDFFVLNYDRPEEWWCRQHCKGCTRENIFFDRTGETSVFLDQGYTTDNYVPDAVRAMDTYWFHAMMLVKYFKRNDIFKLFKNINDFMFQAHVNLLLSHYDTLDYGGWETKVKHCVPVEKQEHLKAYFVTAEISAIHTAMEKCIMLFKKDSEEICKAKGIDYPVNISEQVMSYFTKMTTAH